LRKFDPFDCFALDSLKA